MAGNSSLDQADGKNLVWFGELERKFSQIIKDYFHLPFFLLIILWTRGWSYNSASGCRLASESEAQFTSFNLCQFFL
jgi:hypothetical protein